MQTKKKDKVILNSLLQTNFLSILELINEKVIITMISLALIIDFH